MAFLEQVLNKIQETVESGGDTQEVDSLLQKELSKLDEKLDNDLAKELRTWAINKLNKLSEAQSEQAKKFAQNIVVFSNKIFSSLDVSKASNTKVEIVIVGYEVVLEAFTPDEISHEGWAFLKKELGCAYSRRIRGETAENLEVAVQAFKSALEVYTPETLTERWAETLNNLGNIYRYRIRGEKADNLEEAINSHKLVLKKYSREASSEIWAETQNNIGCAFLERKNEHRAKNIKKAIDAFQYALEVYTCEDYPNEYALTKNNLGRAYLEMEKDDKEENLELAIKAFHSVLEIEQHHSYQWARTQNNLSSAYLQKKKGDIKENLKLAIQACQAALQVYTPDAFPQEWAITQGELGYAYHQTGEKYHEAYNAFADAITILEDLRGKIVSGSDINADKQKLAEEANPIYQGMVEVCLELAKDNPDYYAHAIEYAERSTARNLVELLANKVFYPKGYIYRNELDELRREISSKQRQKESYEEFKKLQQKRDNLLKKINQLDPSFKFTQQVNPISFKEIQNLVRENTAIIEWYITSSKIITFIITCDKQPIVSISSFKYKDPKGKDLDLIEWCKGYFQAYYAAKGEKDENRKTKLQEEWKNGLTTRLQDLANILHINEILSHIPKNCNRLILVPHRFLHLLPLHALPLPEEQDKCLLDKFEGGVGYAPSCQLLQLNQGFQRTEFSNLFAVQNPHNVLKKLHYAKLEVDVIRKFFSCPEVLEEQNAEEKTLKKSKNLSSSHCCHFSCHGVFDIKSPLESALLLAEFKGSEEESSAKDQKQEQDGRLTLAEIFGLTLDQCRLVTLSACETGMVDPDNISDEYIGLPSGFLFAGSPSVVASLWAVDDISTALLMIKFYENLTKRREEKSFKLEEGAVALALNQAQVWLRDVTRAQLKQSIEQWTKQSIEQWIENLSFTYRDQFNLIDQFNLRSLFSTRMHLEQWIGNLSLGVTDRITLKRLLSQHQDNEQPFCKPYYWAAFCAVGQ
jgi:CHAT domain-containing protein